MKLLISLFATFFLGIACAEIAKDNGVLVLTDDNFNEAIEKYDKLLVEFYAPWCGHCKQLAPNYEAAAKELEPKGFFIAKVDATEHKEVAQKFNIGGFPTLKFFNAGNPIDYNGGRSKEDIVNYVIKKSGPAAKSLTAAGDVDSFAAESDVVVVGYFDKEDSDAAKAFLAAATADDNFTYGIATGAAKGKTANGVVAVIKKFDDLRNELKVTAGTEAKEITDFVAIHALTLVTKFSPEASRQIFGGPVQVHVLYMGKELEGDHKEAMTKAASEFRGKSIHVFVPESENRVIEWFGLSTDDLPAIMIADMRTDTKKYKFPHDKITAKNIISFEKDFFAGKLKPTLKSAEPSADDLKQPVKVLTGKSFEEIVLKNDKDVLVEFYAPWCGHCKALAPKYDQVAELLEGVDSITIAKIDATANEVDVPGVAVQGFPTLYFFKGNDKANPLQYDGEREVSGMLSWLAENAATKFEAPEVPGEAAAADAEEEEEEEEEEEAVGEEL